MGIVSKFSNLFEAELDRRLSEQRPMLASQGDLGGGEDLQKRLKEDGYGRKGLIFDPFTDQGYAGGLFRPKGAGTGFISNMILKLVSRRDPIVSTILNIRANQSSTFHRKQVSRFDTGFEIQPKNQNDEVDQEEIKEIEEFLLNCGRTDQRSEEDKLTFDQFGYMIAHDMLVYGHCAIEMVRDMSGQLYAFLPLPGETIYYANKKLMDKEVINNMIMAYRDAYSKTHGQKDIVYDEAGLNGEEFSFVQVINGKVVEGFTSDELILQKINPTSDIDLMGYAMSPLEKAISMITAHLQIENHQKMFFTHGVASKGLLVIQGDVTPNQLRTLQAQWTNQVTGPNAAWRTPILAGIKGVQWQTLTPESRDMEYAAYQDHVIRTIHACFAIDAEETGFGYLSKGVEQKSLSESSNEWKVTASRDRGLRPLLGRIESLINEQIFPAWNKKYSEKYHFCFVGLDAETRNEEIERLKEEVQLHTTLNEARQQADLDPLEVGGNLILNPELINTQMQAMPFGMFVEKFMGLKGASSRPDLQFFANQYWFQWQTMQMQIMQQQATAQATMTQEPPEKPGKTPKDPDKRREQQDKDAHENEVDQHEQQQAQAQAQAMAIDQFISANPELFKAMSDNLKKAEHNDEHVDKMRDELVKDFEKASERLVRDIMDAVKEDLDDRGESPDPVKMKKSERKKKDGPQA